MILTVSCRRELNYGDFGTPNAVKVMSGIVLKILSIFFIEKCGKCIQKGAQQTGESFLLRFRGGRARGLASRRPPPPTCASLRHPGSPTDKEDRGALGKMFPARPMIEIHDWIHDWNRATQEIHDWHFRCNAPERERRQRRAREDVPCAPHD